MKISNLYESNISSLITFLKSEDSYEYEGNVKEIKSIENLIEYLNVNGYELRPLQGGSHADVYKIGSSEYVLRVSKPNQLHNDLWWDWCKVIKDHHTSSLMPKILFSKSYYYEEKMVLAKAAIMEHVDLLAAHRLGLKTRLYRFEPYIIHLYHYIIGEKIDQWQITDQEAFNVLKSVGASYNDILKFVESVKSVIGTDVHLLDVHSRNLGLRRDGSLVVFDPI